MGLRALCLALALLGRAAIASPEGAAISVSVVDSSGHPVAGVEVQLRLGRTLAAHSQTDAQGHATFSALQAGRYEVSAAKANFETARKADLELAANAAISLELTLVTTLTHSDTVEVQSTVSPVEQVAATPSTLTAVAAKDLPSQPATVSDALPMIPGVVREPGGGLMISAAPASSASPFRSIPSKPSTSTRPLTWPSTAALPPAWLPWKHGAGAKNGSGN
jgi:hypothetical protein